MLFGPVFGAIAVILTGLTTNLAILGGTRLLEGASTAASVPSILGYIALATATSEVLRGKAAARFEGATLAGFGVGFATAPLLFAAFGPVAFFLNALVYGVSFLIYRFGVEDRDREERAAAATTRASRMDLSRYGALLRTSHVWLLAPTWIAVNASIGLWFSQSIFQFSAAELGVSGPGPPPGASRPLEISLTAVVVGVLFGAGLLYWGNRFKNLRRTTIILYGIVGGGILVAGGVAINHGAGLPFVVPLVGALGRGVRVVPPGRRDASGARSAGGHLRALPDRSRGDHGPLQRVPRRRPDHWQPDRRQSRRNGAASTGS